MKTIFLLCALCASAVNLGHSEDWPSSGKDNLRSRSTPETLSSTFTQAWKYNGSSEIVSSPAVADGFVVFGARDGYVKALKESDGSPIWSFQTGGEVISSPSILNGRVYVAANGKVYCLRLSNGAQIWNCPTGGTAEMSSPLVAGNVLYIGSGFPNQKVMAIDLVSHIPIWQQGVEQIVYSSPALADNKVFIGCDSGRYYALDQTTGSEIWSYPTGGDVLLSSPLIIDDSTYLLPGGTNKNFYRVYIDPVNWGSNWELTLTDPSTPTTGTILGTKLATSSPMHAVTFGLVTFVVRFDYSVDIDPDPDVIVWQYVMNEYIIAVDPSAQAVVWQQPLGTLTTSNQNNIPSLGLCPTPAEMQDASYGSILTVCSTLSSEFKIINTSDGSPISTNNLDSTTRSSPAIANGRVFIATKNGSLYAFQCSDNHPPQPPVSGFSPANNETVASSTPTIGWNNAVDQNESSDNLTYEIRVDDDSEVLENYDQIITTNPGITSIILPIPIPDNTRLVYAIRTIDSNLAYSEWSALQTFWVNRTYAAPEPPTNLRTVPGGGYIQLLWNASPSPDVRGYLVNWKQQGGSYGSQIFVGNVTDYTVNELTNWIEYTFRVVAEDYDFLQSSPVEITSRPAYPIALNDIPYDTLINALNDAQSGDTIRLGVGTFVIPQTLQVKEGINIQGYSPHQTFLNGTGLTRAFQLALGNGIKGTFSDFTLYGAQIGIDTSVYSVIIKNTVIRNCNTGIMVGSASATDIINNTIINNVSIGINTDSANTNIRNNIIMKNGYGVYNSAEGNPSITYNDVYSNTTSNYFQLTPGIGNISLDVIFNDEPNNDYREAIDQPTIDMGDPADDYFTEPHPRGTRVNLGAYGNTPYAATSGVLRIVTTTLSDGETNAYYDVMLSTLGGSGPLTWTVTAGTLPPGLSLNASSGRITGTIEVGSAGQYNFSVEVGDYLSATDTQNYTIFISQSTNNNLHIVTNILPDGEVRAMYQASIIAANGFAPYNWSIIAGSLPPNVTLNAAGEISGTTPYGSDNDYTFTAKVIDADSFSVTRTLTIRINAGLASGSSGKGVGKKCFIATAAYGSPLAPSVKILQQFRDEYLLTNNLGKWLVSQYYRNSPPLADYIATHKWAKMISQIVLTPAVAYSWFMVSTRLPVKILTVLLIIFCGLILTCLCRARHGRQVYSSPAPMDIVAQNK